MKIDDKGLQLIKDSEGLRLNSYFCSANVLSIGYGRTKGVFEGMTITQEEAYELLLEDIKYFEEKVSELVTVPLTSNQFSSLVSFAFNLGENALSMSTLLKKLNAGDYKGSAEEFLRWNKAGEVVLEGLTRRRQAERELFLTEETQPTTIRSYRERFEQLIKGHYDFVNELITEIEKLENS